jgi:dTDP-4-amino-4,6-dideoxygalactose transaminase
VFHYLPLHLSDMGRRFGGQPDDCPVTEDISDRLLRLPFYNDLTEKDQARVVAAIRQFDLERTWAITSPVLAASGLS